MTNLTITLDDAIVKKARVRAIQEGTSVSAKVREFLAAYAQSDGPRRNIADALAMPAETAHIPFDPPRAAIAMRAADFE